MNKALYYNIEMEKWIECYDAVFVSEEIEDIPITIIMKKDDEIYAWCNKHIRFEKITEIEGINYKTNSCEMHGYPAFFYLKNKIENNHIQEFDKFDYYKNNVILSPVRWRLGYKQTVTPVFVGVDICEIKMIWHREPPIYCGPRIRRYLYGNSTYNIINEEVRHFNKVIPYPQEIMESTMELLKDSAAKVYGLRPNMSDSIKSVNRGIMAFIFRPYDMNCYALKPYYNNMDFIPKDCKNAYHLICEKLEIHPPKGVKKIYAKNAYAPIIYKALMDLGFKDYNIIRPILYGTRIGGINLVECDKFAFPFLYDGEEKNDYDNDDDYDLENRNKKDNTISPEEIDALLSGPSDIFKPRNTYKKWNKLKFFIELLIRERGEKVAARRLSNYSKGNPERWKIDTCNMIYHNFDKLHDDIKRNYLLRGCTVKLHDELIYEVNHMECYREQIRYRPYERDWECEINGYRFELPSYTDEMADAGREMNNCIASYINKVLDKECTIVLVRKNDKYVACIEIDEYNDCPEIVQALGVNNTKLEGGLLHVVNFWLRRMMMFDVMFELNDDEFDNIPLGKFYYKAIQEKQTPYFLYPEKELRALPRNERGKGFYRALATKAVTRLFETNFELFLRMEEFKDDVEFLHNNFPGLECIAEDAHAGNGEAQLVLGILFDWSFRCGYSKSQYWKMKAHRNGEDYALSLKRYNMICDE